MATLRIIFTPSASSSSSSSSAGAAAMPSASTSSPPVRRRRRSSLVMLGIEKESAWTTVECVLGKPDLLIFGTGAPEPLASMSNLAVSTCTVVEPSPHPAAFGQGFDLCLPNDGGVISVLPFGDRLKVRERGDDAQFGSRLLALAGGQLARTVVQAGRLRKLRPQKRSRRSSISGMIRKVAGMRESAWQERWCSLIECRTTGGCWLQYTDRDDKPPIDLRFVRIVEPSTNPALLKLGRGIDLHTLRGGTLEENRCFTFDEMDGNDKSEALFVAVIEFVDARMKERQAKRDAADADYFTGVETAVAVAAAATAAVAAETVAAAASVPPPPPPVPGPASGAAPGPAQGGPPPGPAPPTPAATTAPPPPPPPPSAAAARAASIFAKASCTATPIVRKPSSKAPTRRKSVGAPPKPKPMGPSGAAPVRRKSMGGESPPKPKPRPNVGKHVSLSAFAGGGAMAKMHRKAERVRRASQTFKTEMNDDAMTPPAVSAASMAELAMEFDGLFKSAAKFKGLKSRNV